MFLMFFCNPLIIRKSGSDQFYFIIDKTSETYRRKSNILLVSAGYLFIYFLLQTTKREETVSIVITLLVAHYTLCKKHS